MKLVLTNKLIKKKKVLPSDPVTPSIKKPSVNKIHHVNSVLSDVVTKKPLKSCGCGK